jgi:acyl-coenzyme A synthetase/AMP-(fatty) acid ligase
MNMAAIALSTGALEAHANKPAFLTAQGAVSNERFQRLVFSYVSGLRVLGLKPGEKILLRMTNSVEFAASFLAVIWLGGIPVLQNFQFGRSELEYIVGLTKPTGIVVAASQSDPGTEGLATSAWRAVAAETQLLKEDGSAVTDNLGGVLPAYDAQPDEPAMIVFTSGTTGRPKGIVHAHRWLDALGDSNRTRIPPQPNDVALATGEWSFISALGHNVLFPLRNGVAGAIMDERASPERILSTIARDRVTLLYSVATLYRRILSQPGIEGRFDLSSLRGVNATGEPLEESVRKEWERRFKCPVWEHFGVSEAQMVLGHAPGVPEKLGTVGISWGARPEILDEHFRPQLRGTSGRLAFHGDYPGFFLEYLGDQQQTEATKRDGWFLTNDLATVDDEGYVTIFGRADDCFKSKGVLIVPRELEDALLQLGTVEEACVFKIPDKEIGYRIGAAVVPRADSSVISLGKQGINDALKGKIAPFKFPHEIFFFEELPKNANGKTQRSEVIRQALATGT